MQVLTTRRAHERAHGRFRLDDGALTAPALTEPLERALYTKDPLKGLVASPSPSVYTFDALGQKFCRELLRAVKSYGDQSPNSMNKYGLVLKDVGLGHVCDFLLEQVVNPLASRYFMTPARLNKIHGFIVHYKTQQKRLATHYDQSDVTFNVCLGDRFTGGNLVFAADNGRKQIEIPHRVGRAILHRGQHLHRALPITRGERYNLILWCTRRP